MNELNVDVKVSKYFDMVQDKIKELITQNPKYKGVDAQIFNDMMFTQGDSPEKDDQILYEVKERVKKACEKNEDMDKVAAELLDTFATRVKTNAFDKDKVNDLPNQLQQEKVLRYLKRYENFK